MITVVRARITELGEIAPLLSPAEQRRAEGLRPAAAAAFVAGRSLLRRLLARWLDRDPRPIEIVGGEDDKPRLAHGEIGFNVAHAGDFVLVALARSREVGVDVEAIDPRRAVTTIAEAALGPDAAFELEHLPADRRAARFTSWWVRVEALCKATGIGLIFPVDTAAAGFAIRDVAMPPGYHAAVAFDGPPARLRTLDWSPT